MTLNPDYTTYNAKNQEPTPCPSLETMEGRFLFLSLLLEQERGGHRSAGDGVSSKTEPTPLCPQTDQKTTKPIVQTVYGLEVAVMPSVQPRGNPSDY